MSQLSQVEIANLALDLVGANLITDINADTSTEAGVIRRMYGPTRRFMLSRHPFDFATQQVNLGPPVADATYEVPDVRFDGAYALPAGWGFVRGVWIAGGRVERWKIFGNFVLVKGSGDDDQPIAEITFDMNEEDLPDFFVEAFVYELAAKIAIPITEKADVAAFVNNEARFKWAMATGQSAQMKTPQRVPSSRFISNRR